MADQQKKLQVGQRLWYVATPRYCNDEYVTVTKVGRKWAEIAGDNWRSTRRIDINTLIEENNGFAPGKCHLDREVYEAGRARDKAWHKLKSDIWYETGPSCPKDVTLENIAQARALLGLKEKTNG